MRQYIVMSILLIMPLQGFCANDRYWIASDINVNKDIETIEMEGGIIKDVKATRVNDYRLEYTIVYKSGSDLKAEREAFLKGYK